MKKGREKMEKSRKMEKSAVANNFYIYSLARGECKVF